MSLKTSANRPSGGTGAAKTSKKRPIASEPCSKRTGWRSSATRAYVSSQWGSSPGMIS
jgi:hypothetical protein